MAQDSPISILSQSVTSLTVTLGTSLLFSSISASSCKTKTLTLTDRVFVGLKGWGTLHSPSEGVVTLPENQTQKCSWHFQRLTLEATLCSLRLPSLVSSCAGCGRPW